MFCKHYVSFLIDYIFVLSFKQNPGQLKSCLKLIEFILRNSNSLSSNCFILLLLKFKNFLLNSHSLQQRVNFNCFSLRSISLPILSIKVCLWKWLESLPSFKLVFKSVCFVEMLSDTLQLRFSCNVSDTIIIFCKNCFCQRFSFCFVKRLIVFNFLFHNLSHPYSIGSKRFIHSLNLRVLNHRFWSLMKISLCVLQRILSISKLKKS